MPRTFISHTFVSGTDGLSVHAGSTDPLVAAARLRLQAVLAVLDPTAGAKDLGDGTGWH